MKNKSGMGCFVFIGVVAALLFLISRPGVIRFLSSTPADLGWVKPTKSYEDLEYENAEMRELLSDISCRLDELCFEIDDVYDETFHSDLLAIRKSLRSIETEALNGSKTDSN